MFEKSPKKNSGFWNHLSCLLQMLIGELGRTTGVFQIWFLNFKLHDLLDFYMENFASRQSWVSKLVHIYIMHLLKCLTLKFLLKCNREFQLNICYFTGCPNKTLKLSLKYVHLRFEKVIFLKQLTKKQRNWGLPFV